MIRCRLVALALLVAPVPGVAEGGGPSAQRARQLTEVGEWALGKWTCESTWNAAPQWPAHVAKATVQVTWGPGGRFLVASYAEASAADNPSPLSATEYLAFDAAANRFVRVSFDSVGGWGMTSGAAWKDGTLTLRGGRDGLTVDGMKLYETMVFSRVSDSEVTFALTFVPSESVTGSEALHGRCLRAAKAKSR